MRIQLLVLLLAPACVQAGTSRPSDSDDEGTPAPSDTGDGQEDTDSPADTADSAPTDTGDSTPADTGDSAPADTGSPQQADLPSHVLDLTNWKLTLPVDDGSGGPLEIGQPELDTYAIDPWFVVSPSGDAVTFAANVGGATTSGSSYPRSELREMDGADKASWSTTSGVHTMTITEAITHTPEVKPHVVAGQIHDAADDVVMIRLEGTRLFVEGRGQDLGTLDASYALGTVFTVKIVASGGEISVYKDDMETPAVVTPWSGDGCYFKAGAYTQSNESKGDAPDAYGEVQIHALTVTHG